MSSSVPNPARPDMITASSSLLISLEGLYANEDISKKQSYILRHTRALIGQRTQALEQFVHSMFHYERAFSRLHSKPLDTERDKSEVEKQQTGIVQRFIELEDQVGEVSKETAMIMKTLEELSAGNGAREQGAHRAGFDAQVWCGIWLDWVEELETWSL